MCSSGNFFCTNIDDISSQYIKQFQSHTYMLKNNPIGVGGGYHVVFKQFIVNPNEIDSDDDDDEEPGVWKQRQIKEKNDLGVLIKHMLSIFEERYPHIKIESYGVEHRMYQIKKSDVVFQGHIHDDACGYTIICYYKIGQNITGGELVLYFYDDNNVAEYVYSPKQGDVVIFSGKHRIQNLSSSSDDYNEDNIRAIVSVFINGAPF